MSGQLVGEVIAASDDLQARGLSPRGFYALIAIAEKASTHDRTATVRWDHVRAALYGASKRTAERAVEDAKRAGVIEVVSPGFRNQYGASRAPIYRIPSLMDHVTQVSPSNELDSDTQVSSSVKVDADKSGVDADKSGVDADTQVSYLTFPYDVSLDEREPRPLGAISNPTKPNSGEIIDAVVVDDPRPDPEPPRYCRAHMPYGSADPCGGCKVARVHHESWTERNGLYPPDKLRAFAELAAEERALEYAVAVRSAIDGCSHCDQAGRLDDLTDCPRHPNFRQSIAS